MTNEGKIDAPEYDALVKKIADARAEVSERTKEAVGALFKAFFAARSEVTAVCWTQYTPYFNDGEACVFSVHGASVSTLTGVDWGANHSRYDDRDEPVFRDSYEIDDNEPLKEALRALERSFDHDIFEAAFGDHARIVVTLEGFHVSEYSHD
jgi:hypothetical protein